MYQQTSHQENCNSLAHFVLNITSEKVLCKIQDDEQKSSGYLTMKLNDFLCRRSTESNEQLINLFNFHCRSEIKCHFKKAIICSNSSWMSPTSKMIDIATVHVWDLEWSLTKVLQYIYKLTINQFWFILYDHNNGHSDPTALFFTANIAFVSFYNSDAVT